MPPQIYLIPVFFMVIGPIVTCSSHRENQERIHFAEKHVSAPGEIIGGAKARIKRSHNPDYYWVKFRFTDESGKRQEGRCEVSLGLFDTHLRDGTVVEPKTTVHYLAKDPSGSACLEIPRESTKEPWGGVIVFLGGCGLLVALFIYDLRKRSCGPTTA